MRRIRLFILLSIVHLYNLYAARIDTLMVFSTVMQKEIPTIVIVPDSYKDSSEGFPVLYLLHGAGGDYTNWSSNVKEILERADQYRMIIVCPDGGVTSWYLDSPVDPSIRYETYFTEELVPVIDRQYRTIADRSSRGITGLSMGGHGAFYLAFRHPDIWGAAGSMSGGLDIRPFPDNWDLSKRLGSQSHHPEHWEQHTVHNQLAGLTDKDLEVFFDCGIGDFFLDVNRQLHTVMLEKNISHTYIERPGAHNFQYWSLAIEYQLLFFYQYFTSP